MLNGRRVARRGDTGEVCDADDACDTATSTVTVVNAPPDVIVAGEVVTDGSASSGASSGGSGDGAGSGEGPGTGTRSLPVQVDADFTDVGVDDTHTATVDWGDESEPQIVTIEQGAGTGSLTATHTYDEAGRLETINHGGGNATRSFTYDNFGYIETDFTEDTTTATLSAAYTFNADGLLIGKIENGSTHAYDYDDLGRLTYWAVTDGDTTTYGYDAASNRTTVTNAAGTRFATSRNVSSLFEARRGR